MSRTGRWKIAASFFAAWLAGCTAGQTIGKMTGVVPGSGSSAAFEINFTSLEYSQPEANALALTLTNASNDTLAVTLAAKNTGASELTGKFPLETYDLAKSTVTAVQANVAVEGSAKQSLAASSGNLSLTALEISGNKISRIAGTFDFSETSGTHFWGYFDVDFSKSSN